MIFLHNTISFSSRNDSVRYSHLTGENNMRSICFSGIHKFGHYWGYLFWFHASLIPRSKASQIKAFFNDHFLLLGFRSAIICQASFSSTQAEADTNTVGASFYFPSLTKFIYLGKAAVCSLKFTSKICMLWWGERVKEVNRRMEKEKSPIFPDQSCPDPWQRSMLTIPKPKTLPSGPEIWLRNTTGWTESFHWPKPSG